MEGIQSLKKDKIQVLLLKLQRATPSTSTTLNRICPVEAIGPEDVLQVERPACPRGNDVYVFIREREREREIEMDDEFLKRLAASVDWLIVTSTASTTSSFLKLSVDDKLIVLLVILRDSLGGFTHLLGFYGILDVLASYWGFYRWFSSFIVDI